MEFRGAKSLIKLSMSWNGNGMGMGMEMEMPSIFKLEFKWFIFKDKNGNAHRKRQKNTISKEMICFKQNYYFEREKNGNFVSNVVEWGLLAVKCSCTIEIPSYQNMLFWQLWKWKCCLSHLFSWKNLLQPLDLFDTPLPPSNASVKPPHYPSPSTKSKKFTQFLLSLDTIHAHFTCYFNFHIRAFIGCLRSLMCALALSLSLSVIKR